MKREGQKKKYGVLMVKNALKFSFNVLFAYVFQIIFGSDNILPGVAICVGLTSLPDMELGIKKLPMCGIIIGLYTGAGIVAQFALADAWIAGIANFLFLILILGISAEPVEKKTSISFMLCFIFCQANPAAPNKLGMRIAALFTGGLIVAAVSAVKWKKKDCGTECRGLLEQITLCMKRKGYILRSSAGIAAVMAIGMLLRIERPMWLSIVVMSLTQVDFQDTKNRIMYRSMATILGAAIFIGIFLQFIPSQYALIFILILGYFSFFTSEYKYTQIVNAICALNASLLVLDAERAIIMRIFCLALGITVTLGMWKAQHLVKQAVSYLGS